MRNRWMTVWLIAGFCFCALAAEAGDPGIVKEKPAAGPYVEIDGGYMVPYSETIPGTEITFEMVPIPGGEFLMGSPADEPGRKKDEGPQFRVQVDPMWVGKHEVTWREYQHYMKLYHPVMEMRNREIRIVTAENQADAITTPTPLYSPDMTYLQGQDPNDPAVTMTPLAARQYTKMLSLLTQRFYRLPCEAEWEYAARGGTTTTLPFEEGEAVLEEHAWHKGNTLDEKLQEHQYQHVGLKKPNGFGLHDMIGNVSELVLDEYVDDHYKQFRGKTVHWTQTIVWPKKSLERVHRGGSWRSKPKDMRVAARDFTDEEIWKNRDPNLPLSPWWYTEEEGRATGFRLVRPLHAPETQDDRLKFWEDMGEHVVNDVEGRIRDGKSAYGLVDPDLPKALEALRKPSGAE